MDYIEKLKTLREDSDKGQDEIAKILNCKQSAVSKYENGKLESRRDKLKSASSKLLHFGKALLYHNSIGAI